MKKTSEFNFSILFLLAIALSSFSLGATTTGSDCNLNVSLINQDPYPAIPGEVVKLVFQLDGIDSYACGDVEFSLTENFPFTLDPSSERSYSIKAGTYTTKDYKTYFQAPFKVRVSEQALEGENILEVKYKSSNQVSGSYLSKQFNIQVKDLISDFEIFVKNYDFSTNIVTFQVLNIGKEDISAVTVEVPKQDEVIVKGPNRNIVGDLDSNEDTTADFEMSANSSEINLVVYYTDSTGERRHISKIVSFDSNYFVGRKADVQTTSSWNYIIIFVIILLIAYFIYKKFIKKKKSKSLAN